MIWSYASPRPRRGLTLIEVLAVVGILLILVGLLFPAAARLMRQSEVTRTQAEVNRIATAIRNYYMECGENPFKGSSGGGWDVGRDMRAGPKAELQAMYRRLSDPTQNPAHRVFLDLPLDEDGILRDPWGNVYRFIFADPDQASGVAADGRAISGTPDHVSLAGGMLVVVRSLGPNGTMEAFTASGADDILSYK